MATIANGYEAKFAAVAASSSGDNTVVAAVSGKKIKVVSCVIIASAAVNMKFKSGAGTDLSGLYYLAANAGVVVGNSNNPFIETAEGQALVINLSGATAVGGHLTYIVE